MASPPRLWIEALGAPTSTTTLSLDPEIFWSIAVVAGVAWAVRAGSRMGLDVRRTYWVALVGMFGALVGGQLLAALLDGPPGGVLEALSSLSGPRSFFGGLAGGAIAAGAYLLCRRLPLTRYGDALVPGVALGYAVARLGCFFNGDDFGTITAAPWGVRFSPGTLAYADHVARGWIEPAARWSLPTHPVQLYDASLALVLLTICERSSLQAPGRRLCLFALGYGGSRFMLQWLRGDWSPAFGHLSVAHVFSVLLMLAGLALWQTLPRSRPDRVARQAPDVRALRVEGVGRAART